jgi:hypothetical protein
VKRDGSGDKPIPFREWLETATGVLGWRPREFWQCSLVEYFAAIEGWNRAQRGMSGKPEPVTREEAEEMFAAEERRVARLRANG